MKKKSVFFMMDDPLNHEDAYSEAELKSVNRWMEETVLLRRSLIRQKEILEATLEAFALSGEPDKGNVTPRPNSGVGNRRCTCLKCGALFYLERGHVCQAR